MSDKRPLQRTLPVILIVLVGIVAYSNTFDVPFLFDDYITIRENPVVKDLSFFEEPSTAEAPLNGISEHLYSHFKNRYIGFLTFALNYRAHGLDVFGYHVVNLSIHILNAALVYLLVILLFRTPRLEDAALRGRARPIALFAAILFVAHPVQTQAVTYMYQRFASLATLCYLASLAGYLRFRLSEGSVQRKLFYAGAVLSALVAMKIKEIAFTLPVMIGLVEVMFFRADRMRRIIWLAPLLLTMLVIPLSIMDMDRPLSEAIGDSMRTQETISRNDYLITQARVLVTYLRILALPVNQNLDYDYPVFISFLNLEIIVSLLLLLTVITLGGYCLYHSRRFRPELLIVAFGVFWFFIALSVESSVIALADVIFEHRLYLPSVGILSAASVATFMLFERFGNTKARFLKGAIFVLLPLVLMFTTYARNEVWSDKLSLWWDAVRKSPYKVRAQVNLADAFKDFGMLDEAIEHYRIALHIGPETAELHNNLGNAYLRGGMTDEGVRHFERAIVLNPKLMMAHYNLGVVHLSRSEVDEALASFKRAVMLNPYYSDAHNNLGVAYAKKGLSSKAIEHFETAVRLKPENTEARRNLENEQQRSGFNK